MFAHCSQWYSLLTLSASKSVVAISVDFACVVKTQFCVAEVASYQTSKRGFQDCSIMKTLKKVRKKNN